MLKRELHYLTQIHSKNYNLYLCEKAFFGKKCYPFEQSYGGEQVGSLFLDFFLFAGRTNFKICAGEEDGRTRNFLSLTEVLTNLAHCGHFLALWCKGCRTNLCTETCEGRHFT